MRKIVFFDIDGTLVDDATQILPDSAGRAVEALREQAIWLFSTPAGPAATSTPGF